ncbi:phage tail protein [Paenibacillus alba]|uniref:Phage tail protein n=1 Tax=Paenibacillus alba TaxID=1197127 RepID=A0ABU6G9V7_9BACL|nr:phage tail protein [Paenibacillus alba]MEC0230399.1 phage tail protein [Paenibacillus alba]NQX69427.1 phage tail protein [Paenibacillus alba]
MEMLNFHNIGGAFRFVVELDGLIAAGFSEVTGMKSEVEVKPLWEGGVNTHPHYMVQHTKFPNIVLKRGMSNSNELWEWYYAVSQGKIKRMNGSIILNNAEGHEMCRWNFFRAFPVKWNGPDLNASNGNVAIESLELVHEGLKTIFKN